MATERGQNIRVGTIFIEIIQNARLLWSHASLSRINKPPEILDSSHAESTSTGSHEGRPTSPLCKVMEQFGSFSYGGGVQRVGGHSQPLIPTASPSLTTVEGLPEAEFDSNFLGSDISTTFQGPDTGSSKPSRPQNTASYALENGDNSREQPSSAESGDSSSDESNSGSEDSNDEDQSKSGSSSSSQSGSSSDSGSQSESESKSESGSGSGSSSASESGNESAKAEEDGEEQEDGDESNDPAADSKDQAGKLPKKERLADLKQ
ncbi:transcriptional regulator, partial [Branchiostoma belcheri]